MSMMVQQQEPQQQDSEAKSATAQARLAGLGRDMAAEYQEAESTRALFNDRWLEDLMQYRGQYSQQTMTTLKKTRRSAVYYRQTTTKVNTMAARLMDLLFPQRSKNWGIEPTPDPVLPDEVVMQELEPEIAQIAQGEMQVLMQQMQAQNIVPDNFAMQRLQSECLEKAYRQLDTKEARIKIAKERAQAMERTIDDQLKENGSGSMRRRESWQGACRDVVFSACLYGMGVLKGPLVEQVEEKRFIPAQDSTGNVAWSEETVAQKLSPYFESASIWDIFPDPVAMRPSQMRYVWQAHIMSDKELLDLASFPGFDSEGIRRYMHDTPEGNATLASWEIQIRETNEDNVSAASLKHRYRLYERWGYLSGKQLSDAGLEIPEEQWADVFPSNVWILGERVIKAAINPLEGVDIPYFFYPYMTDETAFWPEGIASLMRTPQAGLNSAVRAMQDNAAASSGPIYGVNMQALSTGADPYEMMANKVFLFDRAGANLNTCFQAITVPSCIEHNLALAKMWMESADEISTPRFNQGDGRVNGAGETASGLSMLMGASNIFLKDHVKDFDDCICAPFITAMFRWNMQWNEDESIKGDYAVTTSGSQSLIAKEVRAQQIPAIINMLQNPMFASRIKADQLLEVTLEQTDLPSERLLRTEEEAKQYEEEQAMMQAMANAEANLQVLLQELQKQGMTPEQVQQQLVMLAGQMQAQAQAAQSGPQQGLPAGVPEPEGVQ